MRYRLRTLLVVLALGPPLLAALWWLTRDPVREERDLGAYPVGDLVIPVQKPSPDEN